MLAGMSLLLNIAEELSFSSLLYNLLDGNYSEHFLILFCILFYRIREHQRRVINASQLGWPCTYVYPVISSVCSIDLACIVLKDARFFLLKFPKSQLRVVFCEMILLC